ncbi:MAG TPA: hypothetical protein VF660_04340 [Actinomycetota bacterium]|jgi:hypothetical protein
MNEQDDEDRRPAIAPDDPTVEADQAEPTKPGPGDSDAAAPPSGDEPDDDVVRPD